MVVDDRLPGGNVKFEKISGDDVYVHQELRDTRYPWFYWKMRVTGAAGRRLVFFFTGSPAVGTRGAAVSRDRGESWSWTDSDTDDPRDGRTGDHADDRTFSWRFGPGDDEVWFCQTIPYMQTDWEKFTARRGAGNGGDFSTNTLCLSRKGRPVECARIGSGRRRILLTARHHAAEASASFVLEGLLDRALADDDVGRWLRGNAEIRVVPFVDKDGVEDGDQGKDRRPHDHNRDYSTGDLPSIYPEIAAIREMTAAWTRGGSLSMMIDFHSPRFRGSWFRKDVSNEYIYQVGGQDRRNAAEQTRFGEIVERMLAGEKIYRAADDYAYGRGWNHAGNYGSRGLPSRRWAELTWPDIALATTFEIPFANARFMTLEPDDLRRFGGAIAAAVVVFFKTAR